jgi:hypothetical protein
LCVGIIALSVIEFLVATCGVQIRELPPTTDFASYYLAGALTAESKSPYDRTATRELAETRHIGFETYPFLYPPAFALLMRPLAQLEYGRARQVWMLVCTLALLMTLALTMSLVFELASQWGLGNTTALWMLLAAYVAASLNSTGVHNDIRAGSVGILLCLCLVISAYALLRQRSWVGGMTLMLATFLKVTPAAIFLWLAWQRRARWLLAGGVVLGFALLAGLPRWGAGVAIDYVTQALLPALETEFPQPMNQSLDAFWSRLLVPSDLVQSPFAAPLAKKWLSFVSSLSLVVMTFRALQRAPRNRQQLPLALCLIVVTILVVMKITWLHTLAAGLFVWPILMTYILKHAKLQAPAARQTGLWACVGFFLSAAHLPVLWQALRHGPAVLLISMHLYGLVILWWVCRRVLSWERLPSSGRD